jgi:hypothetical protein
MTDSDGISEKKNLISIKGQKITKQDYTGLLAFFLVGAFVYAVVFSSCSTIVALGTPTGSVVTYYFNSRSICCHRGE